MLCCHQFCLIIEVSSILEVPIVAILESKFPELVQLRGSYILALNEDYLANLDDNLNLTSGLQMIQSCFFILLLIQILPGTINVSFDKAVI